MFVLDNGNVKTYTILFPGVFANGRKFRARDLSAGMRYVTLRILFQVAASCVCIVFRENSSILNTLSAIILFYVMARVFLTRHISINTSIGRWSYSLAPISLWADHFSMYAMLFIAVFICNKLGVLDNALGDFSVFIEILVVFIGVCPIWSYYFYKKKTNLHKLL